ncbi:AAEL017124-PA [Aedes aegypti]|uniref:AAEL017124-PA n=1 Tax=Aedes aegypti TaxID=7159 RepID=J9HIB7_AEDAE|nr:AAEL017124-PA [Aedes aegypti]
MQCMLLLSWALRISYLLQYPYHLVTSNRSDQPS